MIRNEQSSQNNLLRTSSSIRSVLTPALPSSCSFSSCASRIAFANATFAAVVLPTVLR